ncbi:hypothetical protein OUZ56_013235 [Daphnia magna]|uniref:Uncharacterized protein n=1 Tax=Daphnia magna TaxID=35525 RepID=A0ABQ9Z632_9CRUS|nr:hypothetical protein OUZ56_013235 [Daphnia magna]
MLQQPSPHGLQQQQHQPSDDLYSSDLVHHHSGHHQQQQIQQQQHPHHSSAASLPMDLHLPQGYPFYTTSQTVNSNATSTKSRRMVRGVERLNRYHALRPLD